MNIRRVKWRLVTGFGALGCGLALLASSCTLIVDGDAMTCETDADCVNHPGKTACDTSAGVCISADKCTSSSECGAAQICSYASPRTCVDLKQGNCTDVYPDDEAYYKDDKAVFLGLTAPLSEADVSTGVSIRNGAILAIDEINAKGGANQEFPLVLISCDDQGNRGPAEDNGQTLANMGIQAIIGPAFSGQTIDMTTGPNYDGEGSIERGVLAISSSATSPDITGLNDLAPACRDTTPDECPGLVWRTSPSDKIQGAAMVAYFPELEEIAKNRVAPDPPLTSIKVAILHKGDSYGTNLAQTVENTLKFNGDVLALSQPANYINLDYGDTSQEGVMPDPDKVAMAAAFGADVYLLLGTSELAPVLQDIEDNYPGANKPYYVFGDGGLSSEIATAAAAKGATSRVRGTIPGTQSLLFTQFSARYTNRFPDDQTGGPEVFGAAGAYDAVYLLSFAATAARGAQLLGVEYARGLTKLADTSKAALEVGSSDFGDVNGSLNNGDTVNIDGVSGPLDFDITSGEAPSDVQIWCLDSVAGSGTYSTHYFEALTGTMQGTPDTGGTNCPF
ncbi:MAG: ABC transporter substrate-binding protein [Polyangiaceae bacterium]